MTYFKMAGAICALLTLLTAESCTPSLLPFSLEVPPVVLVPTTLANVTDGRGRFREIYCAIRADHGAALPDDLPCEEALVRLLDEPVATGSPVDLTRPPQRLRIVVVPGIFEECVRSKVQTLSDGLEHLKRHGYQTGSIPVSGRSGSTHNAVEVRDFLMHLTLAPGERVLLVAYSKGAADALEALTTYPEVIPRVAALATIGGVVAGSPIADYYASLYHDLLRDLRLTDCPPGDGHGVESISQRVRLAALAHTRLPPSVQYFSLVGIPGPERISTALRPFYKQLAKIDPRNDGQMIFHDAIIPGGTLLGFVRADHWALAMPFSRQPGAFPLSESLIEHNRFPREVLLESIIRFIEERL
jgi:pimeloyl-ACP methyl ester carboxylesterase